MEEKRINVDDLRKASIQLKKDIQEGLEKEEWDEEADEIQESTDSLEEKFESAQELAEAELKSEERIQRIIIRENNQIN